MPVVKEEPKPEEVAVSEAKDADKENTDTNNYPSEEVDEEVEKEKKVQRVMSRLNRQLCYLNLESAT
jgi:hypothetical protein